MTATTDLARMVPGFDFLQGLLKNAGAGLPNFGAWVAPTLNPEELEKKIQELKTVHFWLEQNGKLLATTIQAMEVQRMTLSTLQSMNVPLADLSEALKIKMPAFTPGSAPAAAPAPKSPAPAAETGAPPAVDPLQWWGALTQQFTELATQAMKNTATDSARSLAGALVKSSLDSAAGALKKAASLPAKAAVKAVTKRARPTPRGPLKHPAAKRGAR